MLRSIANSIRKPVGRVRRLIEPFVRCKVDDYVTNRRWLGAHDGFSSCATLIAIRMRTKLSSIGWRRSTPDVRSRLELCTLPKRIRDWSPYRLCVAWMNDPVEEWSPWGYSKAKELTTNARRQGIGVINPVDRLLNRLQVQRGEAHEAAGVPVPNTKRIANIEEFKETALGMQLPLVVREEWGTEVISLGSIR